VRYGFVYVMSNKVRSVLYIGVTNDLIRRVHEHKSGVIEGFTKRYKCKYLIYYEYFDNIENAIKREKQLKNWKRDWKLDLIKKMNPNLKDLSEEIES
jgi:putative endonuclease